MSKRWYIIHAYSNFEKKVAESIQERASLAGIEDLIDEIVVPTEDVVEIDYIDNFSYLNYLLKKF